MTGREYGLIGAVAELPPLTLVVGRFGIAALALLLAARLGGLGAHTLAELAPPTSCS